MRINLNVEGCGIVAAPVLAPSRAPVLLPLLLSHNLPLPPRSPVRDGQTAQTSPHRPRLVVSRSTCPPLSPSLHTNSFIIGTSAVINTHPCKRPQGDTLPQQEPGIIVETCTNCPSQESICASLQCSCRPQSLTGALPGASLRMSEVSDAMLKGREGPTGTAVLV